MTDYLIASGETVFHILRKGRIEPAQRTSAANSRRSVSGAWAKESRAL
jgi:hypothetical protein